MEKENNSLIIGLNIELTVEKSRIVKNPDMMNFIMHRIAHNKGKYVINEDDGNNYFYWVESWSFGNGIDEIYLKEIKMQIRKNYYDSQNVDHVSINEVVTTSNDFGHFVNNDVRIH